MIKERYVNFEVASLLRDKGFDGEVHNWYIGDENLQAPSQAVACDWIEEKYNIAIVLDLTILGFEPGFFNGHKDPNTASTAFLAGKDYIPMPDGDNPDGSWSSKELAYNEALKYVLTNLI